MAQKYRQQLQKKFNKYNETAWLLYFFSALLLIPLLRHILGGNLFPSLISGMVLFDFLLAATWVSKGLSNKRQAQQSKVPLKTSFPLLFLGACLLGIGTFIAAFGLAEYHLFAALGLGIATFLGSILWYGLDGLPATASLSEIDDEADKEILLKTGQHIAEIKNSSEQITDVQLQTQLQQVIQSSENILQHLTENPQKISKAGRFLHHYLSATQSVISRYAETHKQVDDENLDENFKQVLQSIANSFKNQHDKLLAKDVFDLDVDIEVLNTLLEKQGIK